MTTHPFHRRHAGHTVREMVLTGRGGQKRTLRVCDHCKKAHGEPHAGFPKQVAATPRKARSARRAAPTAGMFTVATKRRPR